jgi:hypothetical protein
MRNERASQYERIFFEKAFHTRSLFPFIRGYTGFGDEFRLSADTVLTRCRLETAFVVQRTEWLFGNVV